MKEPESPTNQRYVKFRMPGPEFQLSISELNAYTTVRFRNGTPCLKMNELSSLIRTAKMYLDFHMVQAPALRNASLDLTPLLTDSVARREFREGNHPAYGQTPGVRYVTREQWTNNNFFKEEREPVDLCFQAGNGLQANHIEDLDLSQAETRRWVDKYP